MGIKINRSLETVLLQYALDTYGTWSRGDKGTALIMIRNLPSNRIPFIMTIITLKSVQDGRHAEFTLWIKEATLCK